MERGSRQEPFRKKAEGKGRGKLDSFSSVLSPGWAASNKRREKRKKVITDTVHCWKNALENRL